MPRYFKLLCFDIGALIFLKTVDIISTVFRTVNLALVPCECTVPASKLLLQEINQLIGIELLTSTFIESFSS